MATMPAPWECRALVWERSALETARDARGYYFSDPTVLDRFDAALAALRTAEVEHRAATGCADNH